MQELASAAITLGGGVANDSRGRPGRRQVTVLRREDWDDACRDAGAEMPWTSRRANLFVEHVELRGRIGYDLRVGDAVLTITGETRPCVRMDEAQTGLRAALAPRWRGGVTCKVIKPGRVGVGDAITVTRQVPRQLALAAHATVRTWLKRSRRLTRGAGRLLRGLSVR